MQICARFAGRIHLAEHTPSYRLDKNRFGQMERSSEETIIVATYSNWNDAEVAKSFLEDRGIASFVAADEVHPPVQLAHGARLRVMTSRADEAVEALSDAGMLPREASAEDREHAQGATNRLTTWTFLVIFALILAALLAAVL